MRHFKCFDVPYSLNPSSTQLNHLDRRVSHPLQRERVSIVTLSCRVCLKGM